MTVSGTCHNLAAHRRDEQAAALVVVKMTSLVAFTGDTPIITQSCTSKSAVRNGSCSAIFPTPLFLTYAEVREQQQTEVPSSAVFAHYDLLNNIFHQFF